MLYPYIKKQYESLLRGKQVLRKRGPHVAYKQRSARCITPLEILTKCPINVVALKPVGA